MPRPLQLKLPRLAAMLSEEAKCHWKEELIPFKMMSVLFLYDESGRKY